MMKKQIKTLFLTIPGKPIAKERARKGKYGNIYNSQSDLKIRIQNIIKSQLPEGFKIIKKDIPVRVDVFWFFEPAKNKQTKKFLDLIKNDDYPYIIKPDRDNCDKATMDFALSKIVMHDDNQVYLGTIGKFYSMDPRTEISLIWKE